MVSNSFRDMYFGIDRIGFCPQCQSIKWKPIMNIFHATEERDILDSLTVQ